LRQSNEQRQAEIQRTEVRKQQSKAQEAEDAKKRIQIAEDWERLNISLIQEHKHMIFKNYIESVEEDDYGNVSMERWGQYSDYIGVPIGDVKDNAFINGRGFNRGFPYFWKNVLVSKNDYRADTWFDGWWKYKIEKLGRHTETEWYEVINDWISEYAIGPVSDEVAA